MRRVSVAQLREITQLALAKAHATESYYRTNHDPNPQVQEMRSINKGCVGALEATLLALNGDLVLLKIMAGV